jgi:hypothetical protein
LNHIAASLARIGEQFNDVVTESANETAMYKARVAELEARSSLEGSQSTRSSLQSNVEHKLNLVRRTMFGLLQELGVNQSCSIHAWQSFPNARFPSQSPKGRYQRLAILPDHASPLPRGICICRLRDDLTEHSIHLGQACIETSTKAGKCQ